jgi:hypothetical protein
MARKTLEITGPLWSATAEVVELADPQDDLAWRSLFVDRTPDGRDKLSLPGTVLALVSVKEVVVTPGRGTDPSFRWKRSRQWSKPVTLGKTPTNSLRHLLNIGRLALLLLRTGPDGLARARCLAGEIILDAMDPVPTTDIEGLYRGLGLAAPDKDAIEKERKKRAGAAGLAGALTVHGSGLSIYGAVRLPWKAQGEPLAAPFFLQQDPDRQGKLKLTIETERMTGEERDNWLSSWQGLARYLTPNNPVLPGAQPGDHSGVPQWATLEVTNPLAIPRLFWQIHTWGQPELAFEAGEFELLLSDRQPYGLQPPTSVARLSPELEVVSKDGDLLLRFGGGSADDAPVVYTWTGPHGETLRAEKPLTLAFDPVETARFLRQRQELPEPEWSPKRDAVQTAPPASDAQTKPVDPAVLWGFVPLSDGWAQLPVPNLSEQIYLDAKLANLPDPAQQAAETKPLLQGAVTFDNDDQGTLRPPAGEQPFSVTLTGVQAVSGTWTLELQDGGDYHIERAQLSLHGPELILDGLLWFGTGRPTVSDALPNLDDWLAGLRPITLRTLDRDPLFPPPIVIDLDRFGIRRRDSGSAQLQAWSWQYRAEEKILGYLISEHVLPADAFRRYAPLAWRRHPHLPMIQAMPLTQNQVPPNAPSASRQLMPFALPAAEPGAGPAIPDGWRFGGGGDNGAAAWPKCQSEGLASSEEWQESPDLPMVALSLPGLVLHPKPGMALSGQMVEMGWQYRFDLPYLDEVNALAQLPKVEPNPARETTLQTPATPPQPKPPLAREDYQAHWRRLAELARLAAADAVVAIEGPDNGRAAVQHLVEPHEWPVEPTLKLDAYPGTLTLAGQNKPCLSLSGESALEGISGHFAEANGELTLLDGTEGAESDPYVLRAGSMAAHRAAVDGKNGLRDQRGLARCASAVVQLGDGRFLKTTVQREGLSDEQTSTYELTSALDPVTLHLASGAAGASGSSGPTWQLWFRDLPLKDDVFQRPAAGEDINDPNALAPENDVRAGYEWRLGASDRPGGPLVLYKLHFYPLRLQRLRLDDGGVRQVRIAGRLQLPLAEIGEVVELADLSNVVILTFEADDGGRIHFTKIELDTANKTSGEWPLAASGSELVDAPRLLWGGITKEGDGLQIQEAKLQFFLFGVRWSIPWDVLQLPSNEAYEYTPSTGGGATATPQPLAFQRLKLTLDLESPSPQHTIQVSLDVNLGGRTAAGAAFQATVRCDYENSDQGEDWRFSCQDVWLFDDLAIGDPALVLHQNTLQFSWQTASPRQDLSRLQFLPGMHLNPATTSVPGFAVLSFSAVPKEPVPDLCTESAFLEALLSFQWGASLQSGAAEPERSPEEVFGSSAGDLAVGYTSNWQPSKGQWQDSFLLNGFVEVKNLISWPEELVATNPQKTEWRVPAAPSLNHLRHTVRILFNQHHLPGKLLRIGAGPLLYNLHDDVVWQFLAVVEHQSALVKGVSDLQVSQDHRWTTMQEVRVFTPPGFKEALRDSHALVPVSPAYVAVTDPPLDEDTTEGSKMRLLLRWRGDLPKDPWTVVQYGGGEGPEDLFWKFKISKEGEHKTEEWVHAKQLGAGPLRWVIYDGEPPGGKRLAVSDPFHFPQAGKRRTITVTVSPWLGAELDQMGGALIVEASAAHWINQDPVNRTNGSTLEPTVLQYLPTGSQLAILSNPDDYPPTNPHDPQWLLLTMPFLGRLQPGERDGLAGSSQADMPLRVDPILCLQRQVQPSQAPHRALALALAHRVDGQQDVTIRLSEFDTDAGRRFARLDTLSLQRNWFSIHKPPPELPPGRLASVMATLADTPARLSRAAALRHVFDSFEEDESPEAQLKWWHDSLLATPALRSATGKDAALNGWLLTGIHLQSSSLTGEVDAAPAYHAAATLIAVPDRPDHRCVRFAVSPYLGLGFKPGPPPENAELNLSSSELLCLDQAIGELRPVASRFWERRMFDPKLKGERLDEAIASAQHSWALQIRQRLDPDSPIAILRLREIRKREQGQQAEQLPDQQVLITTYSFAIVTLADDPAARLGRRVFPLRAQVDRLHFAEGQFGGYGMPTAAKPFELAPPQTTGVQPAYAPKDAQDGGEWQWGLSALRLALAYADRKAGVAGALPTDTRTTLWWQALQHRVQYRPGEATLPRLFRAKAIKSLLPVLPQPPMPALDPTAQPGRWQPILPGAMRYWLIGARPGVMLALRHQLLRQGLADGAPELMVSGSVPVQHRVPRPVPLPRNDPARPQVALRTWASPFAPTQTVLASPDPADEAFFGSYVGGDGSTVPAKGVRLALIAPERGEIGPGWEGEFTLRATSRSEEGEFSPLMSAAVVVEGTSFACDVGQPAGDGSLTCKVSDTAGLKIQLAGLAAGSVFSLQVRVSAGDDDAGNAGFRQTIDLPLRVSNESIVPLPLEPRFIHFEDPEYNRRLASTAVQASGAITLDGTSHSVTFSADRRDYNPEGSVAWRFDWAGPAPTGCTAKLSIQRVRAEDARPVTLILKEETAKAANLKRSEPTAPDDPPEYELQGDTLYQCSLLDLRVHAALSTDGQPVPASLRPDDVLLLHLRIEGGVTPLDLRLAVNVVAAPVIPAPEAAYALLRWQQNDGQQEVECVRFAWSPQPSRVELICAQDLRTGVVRRRAVFQWRDSVRPGTLIGQGYAVQKIAQTGSTHVPGAQTDSMHVPGAEAGSDSGVGLV